MELSFSPYVGAFLWMSVLLLVGTLLRARVGVFQKFLFPSAVLAGVLGFMLKSFGFVGMPVGEAWAKIPSGTFALITAHLFAFGFVGIGLMGAGQRGKGPDVFKGALWMTLVFLGMLMLQSCIGVAVMALWQAVTGEGGTAAAGFLAGHGFTQGPGQTLAIATAWQEAGYPDVVSLGLAFSAAGFLAAALVGVPVATWSIRKHLGDNAPAQISPWFCAGMEAPGERTCGAVNITHSANVDSLSYHLAVMGLVYFAGFGIAHVLRHYFLPPGLDRISFGFLYTWGLVMAFGFRKAMGLGGGGDFLDEDTIRRLTGVSVDYMVISVMMAVEIGTLGKYLVPFVLVTLLVTVVTTAVILFLGRHVGKHGLERSLVMLGYCTGTGASGLLLLRLADPQFKTTAAVETGIMAVFCMLAMPLFLMIFIMPRFGVGILVFVELTVGAAVFLLIFMLHKAGYFGHETKERS